MSSIPEIVHRRNRLGYNQARLAKRVGWYPETLIDLEKMRLPEGAWEALVAHVDSVLDAIEREAGGKEVKRARQGVNAT